MSFVALIFVLLGASASSASAAATRSRILEFAPFSQSSAFLFPTGTAVNQETGNVYVADSKAGGQIDIFSAEGGIPAGGVPAKIEGLEFGEGEPEGVAIDNACYYHEPRLTGSACEAFDSTNGDVYVAESVAHAIVRFKLNTTTHEYEKEAFVPYEETLEPNGVAVAANGDVYIANYQQQTIAVYSDSGTKIGSIAQHLIENPAYIAVSSPGVVYLGQYAGRVAKLEVGSGYTVTHEELLPLAPQAAGNRSGAVTVDAHNDAYVDEGGSIVGYSPSGTVSEEFGSEAISESKGIAVNDESGDVYVSNPTDGNLVVFGPPEEPPSPPSVTIAPVASVSQHGATFSGTVDAHHESTIYRFEDSTDGSHWTSLGEQAAGSGSTPVSVTESVTDLLGQTTYHVRLVAVNAAGTSGLPYAEETFTTPAGPPQVTASAATGIADTEATLRAEVFPEQHPATYRFEYGTTTAYGTSVPADEGEIGTAPAGVAQTLTGLTADTTYHFRVVASNGIGAPTISADQSFTTSRAPEGATPCPNEGERRESSVDPVSLAPYSTQLSECRAFELVTPAIKGADNLIPGVGSDYVNPESSSILRGAGVESISSDGSPLLISSLTSLGTGSIGADAEQNATQYEVVRQQGGWATTALSPPPSELRGAKEELANPFDASEGIWAAATPSQAENVGSFYRRGADGEFTAIGPVAHFSSSEAELKIGRETDRVVGASKSLEDVVFQLDSAPGGDPTPLWPGDGTVTRGTQLTASLYEYFGALPRGQGGHADEPQLVGLDNANRQITECGTGLGGDVGEAANPARTGISAGGSTVVFTAQAGGCVPNATGPIVKQVYARIGSPGSQTTVDVAGTSGCGMSTSCNLTEPVTYDGASESGAKVFFTTAQPLLPGDSDTSNNIYECELPGDAAAPPVASGEFVNACPDLRGVSTTGTSGSANVKSVVAISASGSHVYFIASGVLTDETNSQGRGAEGGKDNLYVWEAPSGAEPAGHIGFIATLSEASLKEAQTTPSGQYLVFTTPADITLDDSSSVSQAFRYDAQSGELVRVSVGQDGFNNDGNTSTDPATLANGSLGRVTMSADGAEVVFQSSDALTQQVQGGINNTYEWREGQVMLISDGSDATPNNGEVPRIGLIGMDSSGTDIYFVTADRLVGQDVDEDSDVYDARIDGGFPAPAPEASCSGEACQGPLSSSSPSSSPLISSSGLPAIGNLAPPKKTTTAAGELDITKHAVKGSTITLSVSTSGKGELSASGTGLKAEKKAVAKAGIYTLKLTLTKAEKASLRKHHKLKLKIKVSFAPSSGAASSATITITVKR